MANSLRVEGLCAGYGAVQVLEGISLGVNDGETVTLLRTNGNGKGGMTVSEAGRKGGERVRDERGVEFYQAIGRKGGELGGRKGGEAVRDKYGPAFYEEIGRKGGQKVRELIEQGKKRI